MGARYYDSSTGKFLSQDPMAAALPEAFLADPQQANMYAYARNNPINRIDPTGLYSQESRKAEEGDTLSSITNDINSYYGLNYSVDTIASINGMGSHDVIRAGDTVSVGTIDGNGNVWTPPMTADGIDRAYWDGLSGMQQRILHYGRNLYQGNIPASTGMMNSGEWNNVGTTGTHNLNGASGNADYRGTGTRSGQQAIYDSSGNLVTSPENMGSYDFAPYLSSNHTVMDVSPWLAWGNSPRDSTTGQQRSAALHGGFLGWVQSVREAFIRY